MEGTECSNVGVAINFNPEREMIRVVLTMHDGEGETVGWVMLPSNKAAEIGAALMNRSMEVGAMEYELAATPMDDRPAKLTNLIERMQSPLN